MTAYSAGVALVVASIPAYLLRFSLAGVPTNVFEIAVAGIIAAGLLTPAVRRRWREAERALPRIVVLLIGLFILAALVGASISDAPRVSFGIFKSWIIVPLLLGWAVYAEARLENQAATIRAALILSGTIVALVSLTQFSWGERLSGIYDVPNSLALYLAPLIVLAAGTALGDARPPRRRLAAGAAALMGVALLVTQSTAGVLSVGATLAVLFLWRRPSRAVLMGGLAIALLAGAYLSTTGRLAYLISPLTAGPANSVSVRWQLWDISWGLIKEHPVLGIGLGQFEPAYQQKLHERIKNFESRISNQDTNEPPLREFVFRDPHNWPLAFWLNTGLVGLVSFAGLHAWLGWRIRRRGATDDQVFTMAAALAVLLLFGLVDTIYWKNDLAALHWSIVFMALAADPGAA